MYSVCKSLYIMYMTSGQGLTTRAVTAIEKAAGKEVWTTLTLNPTPYTLHPTPYTLNPTPLTLHTTPYTLHPAPYASHPTTSTLTPKPQTARCWRSTWRVHRSPDPTKTRIDHIPQYSLVYVLQSNLSVAFALSFSLSLSLSLNTSRTPTP